MNVRAELLDLAGAEAIAPSTDHWSEKARRFVIGLLRDGLYRMVNNALGDVRLLRLSETGGGQMLLPIVMPPAERARNTPANVVSPYAHYIAYTREEVGKSRPGLPVPVLDTVLFPVDLAMRLGRCEAVVYLNNWLLATNPLIELSPTQLAATTAALVARYPDRAIVVRTVVPALMPRWAETLRTNGYHFVRNRRVFIRLPRDRARRDRSNVKADRGLTRRTGYQVVEDRCILECQVPRLEALYRDVYLDKHSRLNPHYARQFFLMTLREEILEYRGLARDGVIDAFIAWQVSGGALVSNVLGYDLSRPRKAGLYRQLFAMLIAESIRVGLPLHMSAGAESFKRLRGGVATEEYEAIYDRHLSPWRRASWRVVSAATRTAARRSSER